MYFYNIFTLFDGNVILIEVEAENINFITLYIIFIMFLHKIILL